MLGDVLAEHVLVELRGTRARVACAWPFRGSAGVLAAVAPLGICRSGKDTDITLWLEAIAGNPRCEGIQLNNTIKESLGPSLGY